MAQEFRGLGFRGLEFRAQEFGGLGSRATSTGLPCQDMIARLLRVSMSLGSMFVTWGGSFLQAFSRFPFQEMFIRLK